MEEEQIKQIILQTQTSETPEDIFKLASRYVNEPELQAALLSGNITFREYAAHFASCGFFAGMRYALENIERIDETEDQ